MLSKKILEINRLFLRLSLDLIELKRSICKLKKLKVKKFSKTLENKKWKNTRMTIQMEILVDQWVMVMTKKAILAKSIKKNDANMLI
jgi:hypothetical protein